MLEQAKQGKTGNSEISTCLYFSPVVSEDLLLHLSDEVTLCAGELPLAAALLAAVPAVAGRRYLVLGLDLRGRPLEVDECVAAFVVSQQHVNVAGGKGALVAQVRDWNANGKIKNVMRCIFNVSHCSAFKTN